MSSQPNKINFYLLLWRQTDLIWEGAKIQTILMILFRLVGFQKLNPMSIGDG